MGAGEAPEQGPERILDRRALTDQLQGLSLDALGFESSLKENLRKLSGEPYGMRSGPL